MGCLCDIIYYEVYTFINVFLLFVTSTFSGDFLFTHKNGHQKTTLILNIYSGLKDDQLFKGPYN